MAISFGILITLLFSSAHHCQEVMPQSSKADQEVNAGTQDNVQNVLSVNLEVNQQQAAAAAATGSSDSQLLNCSTGGGSSKIRGRLFPAPPVDNPNVPSSSSVKVALVYFMRYQLRFQHEQLQEDANETRFNSILPHDNNTTKVFVGSTGATNVTYSVNCSDTRVLWLDETHRFQSPQPIDIMIIYSYKILRMCHSDLAKLLAEREARANIPDESTKTVYYLLLYVDDGGHISDKAEFIKQTFTSNDILGTRVKAFLPDIQDTAMHDIIKSVELESDSSSAAAVGQAGTFWPRIRAPANGNNNASGAAVKRTQTPETWRAAACNLILRTGQPGANGVGGNGAGIGSGSTGPGTNIGPGSLGGNTSDSILNNFSRTSVLFVSVSFIILMVISLAWLVFYYVQRFRYAHAKDRLARRLFNAAKKVLAKMPAKTLKPGDKELEGDCPVCIEPYRNGDVVRSLPCKHLFHKSCVDPWLLEHRTCPMCKNDILKAYGYNIGHSEESVRDGDHLSTGAQSTDGVGGGGGLVIVTGNGHRHRRRRTAAGSANDPDARSVDSAGDRASSSYPPVGLSLARGMLTDSDLHDPFFPSSAPSPSTLQPVLHQNDTQAFSIIPLTVHNAGTTPAIDPLPLHPNVIVYNNNNAVTNDNLLSPGQCSTSSSDDDSSSPIGLRDKNSTRPLFRVNGTGTAAKSPRRQARPTTVCLAGSSTATATRWANPVGGGSSSSTTTTTASPLKFRSAQTGRRRWLQTAGGRNGAGATPTFSLARTILNATRGAAATMAGRSASSHDLCFVRAAAVAANSGGGGDRQQRRPSSINGGAVGGGGGPRHACTFYRGAPSLESL